MDAAGADAFNKGLKPFEEAKKMGFINFGQKEELAAKTGFWAEWERLSTSAKEVESFPEMIKLLRRLQGSGISLNAMTARSERVQEQTMRLLEKMGIVPNEVFFRPDTFVGESLPPDVLKMGWVNQTSSKYNYIGIFDDSSSNVKAALKAGIPAVLQPSANAPDAKFVEGALTRGIETMQGLVTEGKITPKQMQRGLSNLEIMMEIGTRSGKLQPKTFTSIIRNKQIAGNIIKGIL